MTMLRQPEQRLLSQYYDDKELFRAEPTVFYCGENRTDERIMSLDEFKLKYAHWETGQIAGNRPVTEADVPVALKRLREGFAFVGLQEEWELSICLFHVKFGGHCRQVEFLNTRPGNQSAMGTSLYNTSILNGWVDEMDRIVYAEAQSIFFDDLLSFGVSHETCQRCYQEAGFAFA